MKGSVYFQDGILVISNGEAKTSISALSKARKQMDLAARVTEWVLTRVLKNEVTKSVLMTHLFVPKSAERIRNRLDNDSKDEKGVSLFVHYV